MFKTRPRHRPLSFCSGLARARLVACVLDICRTDRATQTGDPGLTWSSPRRLRNSGGCAQTLPWKGILPTEQNVLLSPLPVKYFLLIHLY